MKITVHTLATDDDMGTNSGAFTTEREMWDSLIQSAGSVLHTSYTRADADEWLAENPDKTLHDWWEAHRGDLDSYSCDEVRLDFDLCAQPIPATGSEQVDEALECLKRARDLLKASGNLRTLLKVRCAISSCKGAARIQNYRYARAQRTRIDAVREMINAG